MGGVRAGLCRALQAMRRILDFSFGDGTSQEGFRLVVVEYHRALQVRTLGRRGLFLHKGQVARPLEVAGYQSLSGNMSAENFPCFVFQQPRYQVIPQGMSPSLENIFQLSWKTR